MHHLINALVTQPFPLLSFLCIPRNIKRLCTKSLCIFQRPDCYFAIEIRVVMHNLCKSNIFIRRALNLFLKDLSYCLCQSKQNASYMWANNRKIKKITKIWVLFFVCVILCNCWFRWTLEAESRALNLIECLNRSECFNYLMCSTKNVLKNALKTHKFHEKSSQVMWTASEERCILYLMVHSHLGQKIMSFQL